MSTHKIDVALAKNVPWAPSARPAGAKYAYRVHARHDNTITGSATSRKTAHDIANLIAARMHQLETRGEVPPRFSSFKISPRSTQR